jgi:hypothetical protein
MDAADDVFVADTPGHIAHWDGAGWTGETTVVDAQGFSSLFGTSAGNVWAASRSGSFYRYNAAASSWTKQTDTPFAATSPTLWGTGSNDMWAFGEGSAAHYDGSAWSVSVLFEASLASGWSSSDAWAAGSNAIAHWDGASWTTVPYPSADTLVGIASIGPDLVVAVDTQYAYTWDGTAWSQAVVPVVDGIRTVAATAANQIVAATPTELAQFDGTTWSPMRLPSDEVNNANASINSLVMTPNMYAVVVNLTTVPFVVRALLRTKPWVCEAHETECNNGVDDDCDGLIDSLDPDCP